MIDFESKPDFVNSDGIKWWKDDNLTSYAKKRDITFNISLDLNVWATEFPNGFRSYVITDSKGAIFESQSMEAIGCHIDIMKCAKARKV